MGVSVSAPPHCRPGGRGALEGAIRVLSLVRYRFFLFAGLLPYLLGAAWASGVEGAFRPGPFWLGLFGIFLSVVGVEAFNEYFDSRMGTDRVFNPDDGDPVPDAVLYLGLAAFAGALLVGLQLARSGGWPVLLYAGLGGLAALFYVGPPIRWVYRGLGELMIGLSYGPWMTLGSVQLQTGRFSWGALGVSLIPGLLVMSLAVVNAIPDYHQDRLVGKRNLVVRLGRKGGVYLYAGLAALGLALPAAAVWAGLLPPRALAACAGLPLLVHSARQAFAAYDSPVDFIPAVRSIVLCYVVSTLALAGALLAP